MVLNEAAVLAAKSQKGKRIPLTGGREGPCTEISERGERPSQHETRWGEEDYQRSAEELPRGDFIFCVQGKK